MIAKRVITQDGSGVPSRVCVIYTRWNDSYSWTVDTNGCVRNIRPGSSGLFRFNSTKIGEHKTCVLMGLFMNFLLWYTGQNGVN